MVFSSLTFLFIFFPITLIVYFLTSSRKLRNIVLFISSLIFYAWGEPIYVVLMVFTTLNNYYFSLFIQKAKDNDRTKISKIYLVLSLIISLGILGYFKYYDFLIVNLNNLLNINLDIHNLPLPIGISFYTFQSISYTIDVYRGKLKAQNKFIVLGTYVTLFPQLIAGPIVRYSTIEEELENRTETVDMVAQGLRRFILGLGKKVIIANQMGFIADNIFNNSNTSAGTIMIWIALLAYTFQIYYDFSGYSDMAIGIGKMIGFNFLENFNYPYISKSITEFWRRWHISLSSWFRDYVYIPLGGNRHHAIRNILIVWLLTGLWHGANWNYIVWGVYYGLLLLIEKYILKEVLLRIPGIIKYLYTMIFVVIGWALFRIEDLSQLFQILQTMFVYESISLRTVMIEYQDIFYALPYFSLAIIGSTPLVKNSMEYFEKTKRKFNHIIIDLYHISILFIVVIFLVGDTFNPFIYFKF